MPFWFPFLDVYQNAVQDNVIILSNTKKEGGNRHALILSVSHTY